MRILLVTGSFPPMACGVGDYTRGLAAALSEREGVEVAVLTSAGAGIEKPAGARYALYPTMRDWSDAEFRVVEEAIAAFGPDVVHLQFPTKGYRGKLPWHLPLRLRAPRLPVVQTWHEYFPSTAPLLGQARATWRDLPLALFGSDVIVVRPGYVERMPWWFRTLTARKRFHLIPNAVSVPRVVLGDEARAIERARWAGEGKALLVFFGFCDEHKGIDDLISAMDPARQHLVLVGRIDETDPYQASLVRRIRAPPLEGHVTIAGFLAPPDAARVLSAADAVVLPFRGGGGSWNTSIKAAALQGTFVLTTSTHEHGLDARANVYRARPGDVRELQEALRQYSGRRVASPSPELAGPDWPEVAQRHLEVYRLSAG